MKKLIRNIMIFAAVLSFSAGLPAPAAAVDIADTAIVLEKGDLSGALTSTMNYTLKGGILSITGSGDMPNWETYNYIPWKNEMGSIRAVSIGEGVTSVGVGAFYEAASLREVSLPSTLKNIYAYAFYGCSSLQSLKIPASVTNLAGYALANCRSLNSLTFEGANCTIDRMSFSYSQNGPTIKAYSGSSAQKFASTNKIPFVSLGDTAPVVTAAPKATTTVKTTTTHISTRTTAAAQPGGNTATQAATQKATSAVVTRPGIKPKLVGDANNDGRVNVADSVAVLQYIADHSKYMLNDLQKANADCDGAPGLTGGDAMHIQKLDAGIA
jgi:hypothetical protein